MTDQALTRAEVKLQVDAAYDTYLDAITALGESFGISPPSPRLVQDDSRTHAAAARLYATFSAEQDRINAEYFAPRDARALARQKAESDEDRANVRYAQARDNLAEAQRNFDHEVTRVADMRTAGITVTIEEETHIIATARAQVDHWQSEVARLAQEDAE